MTKEENKKILKRIGLKIRKIREWKQLSQQELAKILDISKEHLSLIENGQRKPTVFVIRKINRELGIPTDFILDLSNNVKYEYQITGKELGLSDASLNRFKLMKQNKNSSIDYLDIINAIFESGIDEPFWRSLYYYFFYGLDVLDIEPNLIDSKSMDVKSYLQDENKDTKLLFNCSLPLKSYGMLNIIAMLKSLEEIKTSLKNKGYEARQLFNTKSDFSVKKPKKNRTNVTKAGEILMKLYDR